MNAKQFCESLKGEAPPAGISAPLAALWWDAKGDWAKAHAQVDELDTREAMAVHAYLHRKEGAAGNAEYWYSRAGKEWRREILEEEWAALVEGLAG